MYGASSQCSKIWEHPCTNWNYSGRLLAVLLGVNLLCSCTECLRTTFVTRKNLQMPFLFYIQNIVQDHKVCIKSVYRKNMARRTRMTENMDSVLNSPHLRVGTWYKKGEKRLGMQCPNCTIRIRSHVFLQGWAWRQLYPQYLCSST